MQQIDEITNNIADAPFTESPEYTNDPALVGTYVNNAKTCWNWNFKVFKNDVEDLGTFKNLISQLNLFKTQANAQSFEVNNAKNDSIDAKNEAIAKALEIESYIIPTEATYGAATIDSKLEGVVYSVDTMDTIRVVETPGATTLSVSVLGYHSANDGGGGLFNYDSTIDKSTANGGTIVDPDETLANQGNGVGDGCWLRQYSGAINVKWFGAKGDGEADDSIAFTRAIQIGDVVSKIGAIHSLSTVLIDREVDLDLRGAEIKFRLDSKFKIMSNDIKIKNGIFRNNNAPIVEIGEYTDNTNYTTLEGFRFEKNKVYDIQTSAIKAYGVVKNVYVEKNRFFSQAFSGNFGAYHMLNGSIEQTDSNINFTDNIVNGYPMAFYANATGYSHGVNISRNTITDCTHGIKPYHCYGSVSSNHIKGNSDFVYAWRGHNWVNNTVEDSTGEHAVKIEVLNGNFSGNTIKNSTNTGIIIDGGISHGSFTNNSITNVGKYGIVIQPDYHFGTQLDGLKIYDNFIRGTGRDGILIIANIKVRSLDIVGNNILGVGRSQSSSFIRAIVSSSINIKITHNTFQENDEYYGIQDGKAGYGVNIEDSAATSSTKFLIAHNQIDATIPVSSEKTYGVRRFLFNFCRDTSTIIQPENGTSYYKHNFDLNSNLTNDIDLSVEKTLGLLQTSQIKVEAVSPSVDETIDIELPEGINSSNIKNIYPYVLESGELVPPGFSRVAGRNFEYRILNSTLKIYNIVNESSNIGLKPMIIYIDYIS